MDKPVVCISIDVERDYRTIGARATRGIEEGLPVYLDLLRSHRIPFDLMVSAEIIDVLPDDLIHRNDDSLALGCHGLSHVPGYLNRLTRSGQERELASATEAIRSRFGRSPTIFRAPNFSANGDTIAILENLGYRVDSSVLPGRLVRKWGVMTLVDHRGVPTEPYFPDRTDFRHPGSSAVLEVPVTPNPKAEGAPIGLGFLHSMGARSCREAMNEVAARYVVFLSHTWEMVSWTSSDPVAPWVRSASSADPSRLDELLSLLDGCEFMNLDRVLVLESQTLGRDLDDRPRGPELADATRGD